MLRSLLPLALAGAVFVGCGGETAAPETQDNTTARVEVVRLTPVAFDDVIEVTGSVEALSDAVLSAQAAGTVTYLAPLGAAVGPGAVVASLDPGMQRAQVAAAGAGVEVAQASIEAARAGVVRAEAAVRQAQAQLDLAEDNYRRQERLYRDSIISALEFEQYRSQRAQAQAGVAQAEAGVVAARAQLTQATAAAGQAGASRQQAAVGLRYTVVGAPFAGRVEEHFVERGEQVTPGRQVARVVQTGRLKVRAGVPERFAGTLRVGDAVDVAVPTRDGVRTGRIAFVGAAVDPASRTFPVEVEVGNLENDLKPAMAARLLIRRSTLSGALVVPREAVVRGTEGTQVFVVVRTDSGLVASARPVRIGTESR
ncbi:MAG TPA: efflux RND transporter periplasmic adaptor subunit, partial [Rhodothermales bacterium]|nr:efflux RND transporter periplasmic adaptor subunit [Rhodothermales bacterium]